MYKDNISDLVICMCFVVVFFFKQKTAYEMRISDWSSDVCSSDLRYGENPHQQAAFYVTGEKRPGVATAQQLQGKELSYNNLNDTDAAFELVSEFADKPKIGRASCRERVCTYV